MSSGRFAEVRTPLVLSILMVLMTQVGYLDLMNAWSGEEETLDDAEPVVAYSPATSVMYGNNSMWVSGANGPVRNAEYIALASDVVLFQGTISKDSMNGCPMAYNASNATVWQPNTGATTSCAGSVKHYVTMIDDITYFTFATTGSNNGNLYAYNPDNDTVYNVSWDFSNHVESAVAIGRTIYLSVPLAWYVGITGTHFAYNIDNQTTWALPSPAGTAWHHQQMMVVGTKIFVHAFTGSGVTNIGPQVFNTENNTWTNVTSMPTKGQFGRPAAGLVSNGQLLFIGSDDASITSPYTSGNGSEYWIYDSNNDTAWPLGDFCAGACHGGLRFDADNAQPQIRDGTEMYFIARSNETSTANQGHYDLWGYSTTNSTTWHMKNLSSNFSQVAVVTISGRPYPTSTYIKLAMLANGDFVIASRSQTSGGQHEMAFYSATNDTLWQPTMETSDSLGFDVPSQFARMLGVYGNTVYLAYSNKLVAYNAANQTGVGQTVPGNQPAYLNGAPIITGSTFAMANHCGNGVAISCPGGHRNTFLQWAPESVTVSDAWNLTPGQRIDGPITGGNGIHFDSGVGIQSLTASAAGAELLVGEAMTDITFEYTGLTTYGNSSTWQVTDFNDGTFTLPGLRMQILVGDTIYFNAAYSTGTELWAYDTSNLSYWQIEVQTGEILTEPGEYMSVLVGDTLYFSADNPSSGTELWAHDTSNHSSWLVSDIRSGAGDSNPGWRMNTLVGDTIYFSAHDGSTGTELWAHATSNHSTWRVDDINSGSGDSNPGNLMELLVGDTLYFSADDGTTGRELWAHNTSNNSDPWQVADINSGGSHSDPGKHLSIVIGDVLYFSADDGSTGGEFYAYNTSNGSDPWLVADLFSGGTGSSPGDKMQVLVDDTLYFDAKGGNAVGRELYAYDTSNFSTWLVEDIYGGSGQSNPGGLFSALADDTIYFSASDGTTGVELWAHATSNHSTWRVDDINSGQSNSNPGRNTHMLIGDTLYLDADDGSTGSELWAYDISNDSSWRLTDIHAGSGNGLLGWQVVQVVEMLIDDTFYFTAQDGTDMEVWAHQPYEITPLTASVAGASCSVSPGLPSGLSIDSSTCTISGTPTSPSTNQTYIITAVMDGVTYQTTVWLTSSYLELTPSAEGAHLYLDVPMTDITFHYNASTATTTAIGTVDGQITTYGNGSVWNAELPGSYCCSNSNFFHNGQMSILVGDTIYFDGDDSGQQSVGRELFAFNTSNETTWLVKDINPNFDSGGYQIGSDSQIGTYMHVLIGDTIYFNANDGSTGHELWAHNTTNQTTWQVADINDGAGNGVTGNGIIHVIDDTLYFTARDDVSSAAELWAYNTSNLTAWNLTDIDTRNGGSIGQKMSMLVGDTIYFDANMGYLTLGGMFAYNTSNHTWWRAVSFTKDPGYGGNGNTMEGYMSTLIGDTIYFDALNETNKQEVFAHNTLNGTTWQVSSFNYSPNSGTATMPGRGMEFVVGDTLYFEAQTSIGSELWAYTTTNRTIWLVDEINPDFQSNSPLGSSPGQYMTILVGDVLYFDAYGPDGDDSQQYSDGRELWALNTSNHTTWQVADLYESSGSNSDGNPGEHMAYLVGDTIYFSAYVYTYSSAIGGAYGQYGVELVAHDTSNGSTWLVEDIRSTGTYGSNPGMPYKQFFVNDALYFAASPTGGTQRWYAHQPAEIASSGSSGTCSISPSLPTGLNFDSSTCTISGTPTAETSNTTYTVTAVISNVTYQGSVWLSTSPYATITSAVEGAALNLGEAMTPITLNYTVNANVGNSSGSSGGTGGSSGSGSGSSSSSIFAYANNKIATGYGATCAILDNGSLTCWGYDGDGQLGNGATLTADQHAPPATSIDLGQGRTAVAVDFTYDHGCAILDDGSVKCWGYDNKGQLGDGGTLPAAPGTHSPSPVSVDLGIGRTAVSIATGYYHSCAVLDNGSIVCWGADDQGQLGNGGLSTSDQSSPSVAVDLGVGRTAVTVTAGRDHVCALLDDGSVKCWGDDFEGQLGAGLHGSTNYNGFGYDSDEPTPVLLPTGRTAIAVEANYRHTCALLDDGSLTCWGSDWRGELGNGGSNTALDYPSTNPIDLGTGRTAVAVSLGRAHTCAILDNGDAKCWGWDSNGQLGDGGVSTYDGSRHTTSPSSTSIDLGTGRTAVAISAGGYHTCAILDNGAMLCWGEDSSGQLGNGATTGTQGSPVSVASSYTWDTTTTSTTWETHPALPAGMSISGGTISGTPSVYALNQTYTIYANQSGYSTTHELYFSVDTDNAHTVVENQTIDPIGFHPPFDNGTTCWTVSPGLPGNLSIDSSTGEITGSVNGTLTNSTYTVTANHNCSGSGTGGSSGNGTTWIPTPPSGIHISNPRMADYFMLEHDDVIYFDAMMSNGKKAVYAFSTVNGTMWNTYDINSINSATNSQPYTGEYLAQFVGDDLFFTIKNGSGNSVYELWVYSTSNGTTWRAMQQTASSYGFAMEFVIGDRLYFDESHFGSQTFKFGVYDTSNHTYWNHSTTILSPTVGSCDVPGANFHTTVGDTIYFDACDASQSYGNEMYAFNTINGSYWRTTDLDNGANDSNPGERMHIVIDDVIYFDAQVGTGAINHHALYAYNTSNGTSWLAADLREPGYDMTPNSMDTAMPRREPVVIGDTLYFDAAASPYTARTSIGYTCSNHQEIYAYNIGNQTAWCVADAGGGGWSGSGHNSGAAHNMLHLIGDVLLFDAETGSTQGGTQTRTNSLWAHNLSNGSTWEITTKTTSSDIISEVGTGFTVFSIDNTLYFPAKNATVGFELWGYDIVNQTYWLVNDTCPGVFNGVSGGSFHTLVHQGVFYSSVRISQNGLGEQYILGVFNPVPSSSTSSGGSGSGSGSGSSTGTSTTETFTFNLQSIADYDGDGLPNDLPSDYDAAEGPTSGLVADDDDDGDGLLDTVETNTGTYVDSSNTGTDPLNPDTDGDGICDGPLAVPGVCIAGPDITNGGSVVDTPIVLLNNSDVDEIAPFYPVTGATYGLSPDLPTSMQFDSSNGSIWGTPDMVMANTTYSMWANLTDGTNTSWTFFLEVLEDLDGDGMPDVLPGDYNATNDPIRTPGLEEDLDDDGDGYNDTAETDTGLYLDGNNTGTDPRDPDTDDDGICDGPGTVPGVCTAGPDLTPFGPPATVVAVNNTMIPSVPPYYAGSGLTYEHTPDLPAGLTIDPNNGFLMGVPTETIGNTTITVYANDTNGNTYSWDFTIEVLEDSDGDGSPDSLPSDYDGDNDSIRAPPGLTEDLDDDNDGMSDEDEILNGTEPLNPDTDGDGFCDGINAVAGVCFAGPDPYPNDANLPLDTDGDGLPDDDSGWTGPPYADDDDDNDGFPDASEDACGSDSLDASSIPADMDGDTICDGDDDDIDGDGIENVNETGDLGVPPGSSPTNPDTDGDGICDGPESPVTSNCTAGPDMFPLDPSAWEDTDGDGYPNELFPPSNSTPPLEEDLDDDNDGWSDIDEVNCGSDPVNASDMPVDENGDGICDVLDLDWDDDGIPNVNETDTGVYNDSSDTGTDPWNPDTDGDGFCDGPFAVSNDTEMICAAGPDPFPHDPNMPMDTDGDGLPNELPEDYTGNLVEDTDDDNDGYSDVSELNCDSDPLDATSTPTNDLDGDGLCDAEDPDVDGDGLSNESELAEGSLTSYMNADTDGDGVCDGPVAPALPAGICVAGPDAFPDDAAAWLDTDGDGDPDELVDGITTDLVLDTDDDNDGWEDVDELACGTDSKDVMSTPFDGDNDGICDVLDTQTLGYTINEVEAEMFEAYVNQSDFILMPNLTGMEPGTWTITPELPDGLLFGGTMARSGDTGMIYGIPTEASPMQNYTVTADNGRVNISFTFGLGVLNDFDGDRVPDEPSLTGLEEDLDDDNDGHSDIIELKCGTDPLNQTSIPDVDEAGNCIEGKYADDDSDDSNGFLMCLMPLCLILLLALLLFALLFRDKVILMGPEPENTTSDPAFLSGEGTKADPFVLKPVKALKAGSTVEAKETISIVNMSPEIRVNLLDLAESTNDKRFRMYEVDGTSEEPGFNLDADDEGRLRLRFVFDDSDDPTYPGDTYDGLLKLGKASVYLSWTVEVKEDKRKMNKIRKEQEAAEKAEKEAKEAEEKAKAEAEAKEAEEKAKAEAEAKAAEEKAAKEAEKKAKAEEKAAAAALAKKEKEEAAAKKKEEAAAKKAKAAEEKAAKEAEEAEAKAKAEAEAKAAEEKAAKEAEKKAKAEEKAAAAALAKKEKEEAAAKKKEEAEAKTAAAAAKKAEEEEQAKKKAEAEAKAAEEKAAKEAEKKAKAEAAAKKKAEKKPAATKEAKKQEELQRVKKRAKSIDFKVIGEASSSELKNEVKKGATTLEVANAKDFAESGSAEINDAKGSNVIAWTGKDGNTLTGVSGVTRVFAAKAVLMVKDDLQVIKGIGPFIEEKLNALGITTYRQLANMTAKLETQVNEAIEFFPGRVKRDQWVAQAKILLGMDAKLDEKALKQAEELERVAQKAEGIDFGVLGVASASEADDLQKIKGIGPFIAEKLNALGIYKFSQLANMTSEIEEEVNVAIEFFPGRVKRDEWAKQAKEFAKN